MRIYLTIIAVCLGLSLAGASAAEKPYWQFELEVELEQSAGKAMPEVYESRRHAYIIVSARVGHILDSHSKNELLPYLMELRRAAPPGSDRIPLLQEWCAMASSGVRGTAADSAYHYVIP